MATFNSLVGGFHIVSTVQQRMDKIIDWTVRKWYMPLSSPDGTRDWVPLGYYDFKFRHEGKGREVWVETPLQHFSLVAHGLRQMDTPGYIDYVVSEAPLNMDVIRCSKVPQGRRSTRNLKVNYLFSFNSTRKISPGVSSLFDSKMSRYFHHGWFRYTILRSQKLLYVLGKRNVYYLFLKRLLPLLLRVLVKINVLLLHIGPQSRSRTEVKREKSASLGSWGSRCQWPSFSR